MLKLGLDLAEWLIYSTKRKMVPPAAKSTICHYPRDFITMSPRPPTRLWFVNDPRLRRKEPTPGNAVNGDRVTAREKPRRSDGLDHFTRFQDCSFTGQSGELTSTRVPGRPERESGPRGRHSC